MTGGSLTVASVVFRLQLDWFGFFLSSLSSVSFPATKDQNAPNGRLAGERGGAFSS